MNGFKKLALATAVAALPVTSFAMQPMSDSQMSGVTGRDGIVLDINTPTTGITTNVVVHDKDGFTGAAGAGAIVITGAKVTAPGAISVAIDAGDTGATTANSASLNVSVTIPNSTVIQTGALSVAKSNDTTATFTTGYTKQSATLLNNSTITLGSTTLNIQLGAEPQGAMIALNTTITGGITISNFAVNDINSGGSINVGQIKMFDDGGANLTVGITGNVTTAGLQLTVGTLGSGTGVDQTMSRVALGNATAVGNGYIGDIEINGLQLAGTTISIHGH